MKWMAAAVAGALGFGIAGIAYATMPMQKQAKGAGVQGVTCVTCHTDKVPRKGAATLNDKGEWLMVEKDRRKAKEVDGAWLKDYKPPK